MVALRRGAACLAVTLALVSLGSAGPQAGDAPNPGAKTPPAKRGGLLLPANVEAELKLDDAQREKVRQIEAGFKQRRQGSVMMTGLKMKALFDRLDDGGDARAAMPVLSIANEVTGVLLKMRQTRLEYEKKLMAVLNDEQRAQYAAWLASSPREKRAERKAKRKEGFEARPLPDLDQELQLTPEQHRKLAEMEREWEHRFRKLLTEEQRRRYDELMRRGQEK
jgi:hypothetical protein